MSDSPYGIRHLSSKVSIYTRVWVSIPEACVLLNATEDNQAGVLAAAKKGDQLESLVHWVREELTAQLSSGCREGGLMSLGAERSGNKALAFHQVGRTEKASSWNNKGLVHLIKTLRALKE